MKYMHQYKQKRWKCFGFGAKKNFFSSVPYLNLLKSRLLKCSCSHHPVSQSNNRKCNAQHFQLLSFFNFSWFGFTCYGLARHKTSLRHAKQKEQNWTITVQLEPKDRKKLSERWIYQLDTNIGQRKNLNSLQLLKAYCTLRNEMKRNEKSVLCEVKNPYFAKWKICTLRNEKSVLCEVKNLYFAKWKICTLRNEKSVLCEMRNPYFAKWKICTLRSEKSVLCEMRNLYFAKWEICSFPEIYRK